MARAEKENMKHYKQLVTKITGFEEYEENFRVCLQFVTSNIKYHRFLDVDSHKVSRTLTGILDKFRIHSEEKKYSALRDLSETFLEKPVFEQKDHGKTDTHYSVLQFLMLIASNPLHREYVDTRKCDIPEIQEEFNWGEYLLEGIECYDPSDGELSDWSDLDNDSDEEPLRSKKAETMAEQSDIVVGPDNQLEQAYIVSEGSSVQWEESSPVDGADWLARNLIPQYWRGEKLEIETGNHRVCHLHSKLEAHRQKTDPLYGRTDRTVVTENILMREIIQMLMGCSRLYLLMYNGEYYQPKPDIAVSHLSEEVLYGYLLEFTRYGSYIKIIQNFTLECRGWKTERKHPMCQTFEAFSASVGHVLHNLQKQLCAVELKLIKQEETLTLMGLSRLLKPHFNIVRVVFMVYMKGVHQGRSLTRVTDKATLLLSTLYNMLCGFDTSFETIADDVHFEGIEGLSESTITSKVLLPMWLQTCRPYINIIDTWISEGYLRDPMKEFIIHRNKDIKTLDETFWEKSFAFHTKAKPSTDNMVTEPDAISQNEYQTMEWVPKFLQPVLQQIVMTGKSMEMLESLDMLAENYGKASLNTFELKEGHLYEKFIASLQNRLAMTEEDGPEKTDKRTNNDSQERGHSMFTEDIERQMKEKDVFDSFLKIHFEKLMTKNKVIDSMLEESFLQTMETLSLGSHPPVELILQECLYPHIQDQYEKVCGKLVDILITEYQLLEYLGAMRKFFLMEAGDTMFSFYTELFDKIRLHEHWKDTTSLTIALHDAMERSYPEEIARFAVLIETTEDRKDNQPINVTDCIKLHYQMPSPIHVIINERCQSIYNQIFGFLLQVKRAKYCLDELRFYDLQKLSDISASDKLLSGFSTENVPRETKIHRMHILRMKLINFVNSLHNYMMTRILHSVGLEFSKDLKTARDLDQIIGIHARYVKTIHKRCLLHKKTSILREAVLRVLNLALRFQTEWDQGADCISLSQIEDTEMEFSRCIQFLSSFLNSVIQRGAFPHLESLALGLTNLVPRK